MNRDTSQDFTIYDRGDVALFAPENLPAQEWWQQHVEDGKTWAGAYALERREACAMVDRMKVEGFKIKVRR